MRSFPIMRGFGWPVVYDVTHSLQKPGGLGTASGGDSEYIEYLARAGVACGVDGVFMEVHDDPANALSDGPNALPLERLDSLLGSLVAINRVTSEVM
jgi:2-dehydro-3-deoxyphosphooctonate aldolase (KDO 8-P synthase)